MAGDGDARFPSTMRLKRRNAFSRAYREGFVWKGSRFSLRVLPRVGDTPGDEGLDVSNETVPRLGIAVSKRCGPAVTRNRIKRRIREAFRHVSKRLPAADILVIPESGLLEESIEELGNGLVQAVNAALARAKERP